ncbi:hypothetical protein [Actinophytocola gossypii]|uniref:DAGKc domain-containing protein n=1 Tax=Actinophytocola gossypii TaxID=2812003 RepID=A0ABT2JE30_9PSEU|nr:hypothetical protein [Actinophytocola gossypii]MCT2586008.1 hypothetical protein [Actinophytocola gossypii]
MGALILGCGPAVTSPDWRKLASASGSDAVEIPTTPGKSDIDALIKAGTSGDVLVHGSDADLAAVVLRLLRLDRLDVTVGYVPVSASSPVARVWGLPADRVGAALDGAAGTVPLIRDDAGGVLLGLGVLAPVHGTVLCDDATPLRGTAERVEVTPDPGAGLAVTVVRKGLLRRRSSTVSGRAVQFGGEQPVTPVRDGVRHPRPMNRWTWYRHTDDLRIRR